jgi:hypothetical protein
MNNRAVEQLTPYEWPTDVQIISTALIDNKPGRSVYLAEFPANLIATFVPSIDYGANGD